MASCKIQCTIAHYCYGSRYPQQLRIVLLYAIVFILGATFMSSCTTIGTSIGFATLKSPDQFGQQRLWGTIGSGFAGFLASRFYASYRTEYVYLLLYLIFTVLCSLVTSASRIQPRRPSDLEHSPKTDNQSDRVKLLPLLKQIDVILFLSMTLIWGASFGAIDPVSFSL